jgi:hypothetical protein
MVRGSCPWVVAVLTLMAVSGTTPAQNVVKFGSITYELVLGSKDFPASDYAARTRILAGTNKRGTLAILDTEAKQRFVLDAFGSRLDGVYVGATRTSRDGPLYWQTGARVTSEYFLPGEPNNFRGRESALEIRRSGSKVGFNDISPNQLNGMLVEYR